MREVASSAKLLEYVRRVGVRESAVQRALRRVTQKLPMSQMQIGPEQAAFMQILVRAIGARRCLEVGTFTGYSALAVALALPPNGRLVCCDVSEEWTAIARRFWKRARVDQKIVLRLAPALQTLDGLLIKGKGRFDFAFIDADKSNYGNYYERCLKLVRKGGVIAIDNTLWSGRVVEARPTDATTRLMKAFNARLSRDRRVEIALLPIGDGLTLAFKR
jgi:predicted O-methyltransferase YrrM